MKYEDIKTHSERCESHPAHQWGMATHQLIMDRLHDEIAELRDYIEAQTKKYFVYTAPPQRKPLTDKQKIDLVTNWFAEDWAIKKALGLLRDYDIKRAHGIGGEE